ncbi:hypothetical protein KYK29_10355 [Shinella daejeonensis]|uniref:hypothetical protein n=1 Tax=Shinella daejeonensis TaxID=659017 RepID=UPI0020C748C6|nr:hypothetical protein [Shinella daejeonensis]MCP8895335.1 hypothetical protein [Shinella daejeonensis]
MDREQLLARRAGYVEELQDVEESLALLESGTFSMQGRNGDGPWEDRTGQMRDMARRSQKTYQDIIADIDERLKELD